MIRLRKQVIASEFVQVGGGTEIVICATDDDMGAVYQGHDSLCWLCLSEISHTSTRHSIAVSGRQNPRKNR
jgi:hypothetical protein